MYVMRMCTHPPGVSQRKWARGVGGEGGKVPPQLSLLAPKWALGLNVPLRGQQCREWHHALPSGRNRASGVRRNACVPARRRDVAGIEVFCRLPDVAIADTEIHASRSKACDRVVDNGSI